MIKKIILGLSVIGMSLSAQAGFIIDEANITGKDMVGIEVTAIFGSGGTETGTWTAFPDVILTSGDPIADAEGFSGGVVAADWSLTQQGFSIGNTPSPGVVFGAWTLTNLGVASGITGFMINGFGGSIAFDTIDTSVVTPNSQGGVSYASAAAPDSVSYSNQVNPSFNDLFFELEVLFNSSPLGINDELKFVADTDKMKIPEPSSLAMLLTGLVFGAARIGSRKSRDNK